MLAAGRPIATSAATTWMVAFLPTTCQARRRSSRWRLPQLWRRRSFRVGLPKATQGWRQCWLFHRQHVQTRRRSLRWRLPQLWRRRSFRADCPKLRKDGGSLASERFNHGEVRYNKADCPNLRVEREFTGTYITGTYNQCGAEGYRRTRMYEMFRALGIQDTSLGKG
ncbi:uncharacterized protein MYCFIDRAFT_211888 [Pseudocercospora fijiensis CIRAD86]|uniref:Uncharacterized protein n=1 Tax=Pseudocercospora fijiensis (strain CIRAD86) TaxID=383855 RepID=M3A5H1_PSEFD|nr:uncharacterized protein MYCFIDRAFT_211888 [Pseudocercospora fijiensis CIRAD86]EME79856.1 hypothetical protein MYCFIDRAFT_211888 [Pseudocercospora fijiensis CIRAD86]